VSGADPQIETDQRDERAGSALDRFWEGVGRQLRYPTGRKGTLIGHLMAALNARPYRLTIDALDIEPGDRVLELGFGPGQSFGLLLSRAGRGRIHGIDQSARMLRHAAYTNRAAIAAGRLELLQGTFDALPWSDGAFDKLLLVNVVYFFDRGGRDIAEAFRVLGRGGRIAAYATDRITMARWPFSHGDTHRTFNADDLIALFESAGFKRARIWIKPVALPLGIKGNIAIAEKR
jgi:ubiquinone/menaquinone biosynthesis C-methylase UbiE